MNDTFLTFCLPAVDGYGNLLENQAVLAFKVSVVSQENAGRTKKVWESLAERRTVLSARIQMLNHDPRFRYFTATGTAELTAEETPLYGDPRTTLKGVYSPVPVSLAAWHRPI
ncbi:MAG: hypothetical protein AB7F50_00745 [Fimbriimonadaceae bacterium]